MRRKKVQKNLQLPPEVAAWLDAEEGKTGASKSRLGIAALLAYRTRSFAEKRLLLSVATKIDKFREGWAGALAGLLLRGGEIRFADPEEQADLERPAISPTGDADGAAEKNEAKRHTKKTSKRQERKRKRK